MKYAALHCHSTYSFQDGVGNIQQWVIGAKEKGIVGLAITDHGDNSSIAELNYWGKKENYPTVFGCELYITDSIEHNRSDNRYRHLVVWVKDEVGYKNLCRLHKLAWDPDHFYYKPRITYDELVRHKDGLVIGSACIAGAIASDVVTLAEQNISLRLHGANQLAEPLTQEQIDTYGSQRPILQNAIDSRFHWFKKNFGEDFYLEMQFNNQCHDWNHKQHCFDDLPGGLDRQRLVSGYYMKVAKQYGMKIIASPDAHMVHEHEKLVQDCQMGTRYMSKTNKSSDGDSEKLGWHFREAYYLPSAEEIAGLYKKNFDFMNDEKVNDLLVNSLEVLEKCRGVNLSKKVYLPNVEIAGAVTGSQKIISEIKRLGIIKDKLAIDPRYKKRLSYEIETLCNNGTIDLSGYFLLLSDVVAWARSNGVGVGPARGSAGGCLVAFALGITKIDPIEWGLLFERFIGPARIKKGTLPDIDIDFSDPTLVFQYLKQKWGEDHVCGISANQTFKFKLAIKDAYRGLTGNSVGQNLEVATKLIGEDESDEVIDAWIASPQVQAWIATGEKENYRPVSSKLRAEIINVARQLRGQMRHRGVHAAAVVVAPEPIHEIVPVARVTKAKDAAASKWVTQYTMKWVEEAGLVKFDILGLSTLTHIQSCLALIKQHRGIDIDPYDLDWNDQEVFANFTPDNVTSVFQFDTEVAKPFLSKMRPKSVSDLAKITALARPGAMDSNQDQVFVARFTGATRVEYPHSALEEVLKETYGVMIYQEDVMAAVQILGGFSAEEADDIRRGMGKKRADLIEDAKQQFIDYAVTHFEDITMKRATELWELIETFARYGFNKSHAMAYAMLAYVCQYLKTKYPREWWCSVLQYEDDESRFKRIFAYVSNLDGITVLPPSINLSERKYSIGPNGDILTPIDYIKKVGETVLEKIIVNRGEGYTSLEDFCSRKYEMRTAGRDKPIMKSIADKNVALQLIWAGCFNELHPGETHKQLVQRYYDWRINHNKETKKNREVLQEEFDRLYANMNMIDEIIFTARAMPVLSIDFHKRLKDVLKGKITPFRKILEAGNNSYVVTAGLITDIEFIKTKKNEDAAFVEFQNAGEILRLVFWPESYRRYFQILKPFKIAQIEGKVNIWNGTRSIVVNRLEIIENITSENKELRNVG